MRRDGDGSVEEAVWWQAVLYGIDAHSTAALSVAL